MQPPQLMKVGEKLYNRREVFKALLFYTASTRKLAIRGRMVRCEQTYGAPRLENPTAPAPSQIHGVPRDPPEL